MMIEALFARDGQTQAFLWMLCAGMFTGLLLHLGRLLRGAVLHAVWDVLTALLLGGMALVITAGCGAPLRAYALLGLLLGLLLYASGFGWLAEKLITRRKTSAPKEGEAVCRDEMNRKVP